MGGKVWAGLAGRLFGAGRPRVGGRPKVEAGEERGGSRARTTSRRNQRVLTPRGCGPMGPGQGRTCAHSPTPITEFRLNPLANQPHAIDAS